MRCRLCSSRRATSLTLRGLEYADCPDCSYLGLAPRFFPQRKSERARYLLHRNDPAEPGYRAWLRAFIEKALLPFAAGAEPRVLDFGSGPCPALSLLLREAGFRVTAYDPHFAPSAGWRKQSWDIIALHEVAEHLRSPSTTLAALARRLEPGGLLALRTRFAPRDRAALETWWYRMDPTHLGFFRVESFGHLASSLGLEPVLIEKPDIAVFRKTGAEA